MILQHNVPSVIERILNAILKSFRSGGTAMFQVQTYRETYEFRIDEYVNSASIHLL